MIQCGYVPYMYLFYSLFAYPVCNTKVVRHALPKTHTHELAAAVITIIHSWYISYIGFYALLFYKDGAIPDLLRNTVHHGSIFSFNYFAFDMMYLMLTHGIQVIRNQYFYHHMVALIITYRGYNNYFDDYNYSVLTWYTLIEAGNTLLKVWELSRHNVPCLHHLITIPFVVTYILCRGVAIIIGTTGLHRDIANQWTFNHACDFGLISFINLISMWFIHKLVRVSRRYLTHI